MVVNDRQAGKRLVCALLRLGALAAASASVTGCGGGYTEAVPAFAGLDPVHPAIVSLNPCSDAILAEVTGPGQLLAISDYSLDPSSTSMNLAAARRYRATSGSVEEVAALAPKIVVAGSFLAPATANALRDLGYRVVTLPIASDIEEARAQIRELAAVAGRPELGRRLIRRIDEAIARNAPPAGARPVSAVLWESGGLVAGDETLIADMMRHTGFINFAGARGLSQADFLPLEQVLSDPPRVIFSAGNPLAQEDRMLHHPVLASLRQTTRIRLDNSMLWCGGPTIPRALDRLTEARRELSRRAEVGAP